MEKTRPVVLAVEKLLKRIRRLEKPVNFINECWQNQRIPIFAKIGKDARRKLLKCNVSPRNIKKMERKNMYTEKKKHQNKMLNFQSEVNTQLEKLKINCSDTRKFKN